MLQSLKLTAKSSWKTVVGRRSFCFWAKRSSLTCVLIGFRDIIDIIFMHIKILQLEWLISNQQTTWQLNGWGSTASSECDIFSSRLPTSWPVAVIRKLQGKANALWEALLIWQRWGYNAFSTNLLCDSVVWLAYMTYSKLKCPWVPHNCAGWGCPQYCQHGDQIHQEPQTNVFLKIQKSEHR